MRTAIQSLTTRAIAYSKALALDRFTAGRDVSQYQLIAWRHFDLPCHLLICSGSVSLRIRQVHLRLYEYRLLIMKSPIFDDIRHHLVNKDNPAREEGELDYERCAAFHNAIVKYGWTASGRSLEQLPTMTCWEANEEEWEHDIDRLLPSMIAFLKWAYDTELPDTEPVYNCGSPFTPYRDLIC